MADANFEDVGDRTLTEREVVAAARAVHELRALRGMIRHGCRDGEIKLKGVLNGVTMIPLYADEVQACIALLIERHSTFLASLNITLEEDPR